MNAETEHKLPFELIVGDTGGEILNGDVPVRWCVTPALVKELEDDKIVDPHILLVSANDKGREMQRQLVPITELMTYVRFTRAGTMKLYGFIINGAEGRKWLHNMYMRKSGGDFRTDVMYGWTSLPHDDLPGEYTRTDVTVEIPAGVFGKEPGPWMKWYVNAWHDTDRVVDQCHFRKRAILAFTLKWIPFLLWATFLITVRVVVTGLLKLAGYWKNVKFFRSFRPFHYGSFEYHLLDDFSFFENDLLVTRMYKTRSGEKEIATMIFTLPFIPLMLLIETALVVFVFKEQPSLFTTLGWTVGIIFAICAFCDLVIWAGQWFNRTTVFESAANAINAKLERITDFINLKYLGYTLATVGGGFLLWLSTIVPTILATLLLTLVPVVALMVVVFNFRDKIGEWLDNAYTVTPAHNDYTEIRELLCPKDANNLKPDIHFIPPKQRTIRLRYLDIKNKVCKPMQM